MCVIGNTIVRQNYLFSVKWLWTIKIANYKDLTLNFAELYAGRFCSGWIAPFRRSVWRKTGFNVISLLCCLFIWQRMAEEDSFLIKLHFSIKELIALSSGKEEFKHGCFSLPVKSAVPSLTHSIVSTCHVTWLYAQTIPEIHRIFPVSHTACHASCNFATFFLQYFNGQTWVIYFPISNPSALTVPNSWG